MDLPAATAPGYDDLDEPAQVEALRPVAVEAAARFGLEVARLEVVLHAYNTTFRVETPTGERWALRLGTNSRSTPAMTRAHQAWQRALRADSEVLVPEPRSTPHGDDLVEVVDSPLDRPVLVTAASWLDGDDLRDISSDQCAVLRRVMAGLHEHAETWQLPADAALPTFESPLLGHADLLTAHPDLDREATAVVAEAMRRARAAYARVNAAGPLHVLHADLHGGNLKQSGDTLAVFDFDDCGIGAPLLDLAISTFYLRDGRDERESALREGYAQARPLPEHDPADFETLVAARQLLLANSILATTTASLRTQYSGYLDTSVGRLARWLDTGRFDRTDPQ